MHAKFFDSPQNKHDYLATFVLLTHALVLVDQRVPLGFVCGYPVGTGGELYGGSMFIKSAASDTLQGRAIQTINERWSAQDDKWCFKGRETIGIPVCKKKYAPFQFSEDRNPDTGESVVSVQRMFGCKCHSDLRKVSLDDKKESFWNFFRGMTLLQLMVCFIIFFLVLSPPFQ